MHAVRGALDVVVVGGRITEDERRARERSDALSQRIDDAAASHRQKVRRVCARRSRAAASGAAMALVAVVMAWPGQCGWPYPASSSRYALKGSPMASISSMAARWSYSVANVLSMAT